MENNTSISLNNVSITKESVAVGELETSGWSASTMPILVMPILARINRMVCTSLGIPLNLLVLSVIVRSRQLWSPRNIFWLTVTFFNLLALVQSLMELTIYYLNQGSDGSHVLLCQIYSVIVGCPYALLLTALTLATADRYSALAHPQFYQDYVTPSRIGWALGIVVVVITGGHTLPHWTGSVTPECRMQYDWLAVTLTFHGLMSTTCFVLQVRIFLYIRSCIRYSSGSIGNKEDPIEKEAIPTIASTLAFANLKRNHQPVVTSPAGRRLNQLELRAARILAFGILPFCLISIPLSITSVAVHFVRTYTSISSEFGVWLTITMQCLRETTTFHLVYIPAVFVAQSSEFRSAGKRCCRCYKPQQPPSNRVYQFA